MKFFLFIFCLFLLFAGQAQNPLFSIEAGAGIAYNPSVKRYEAPYRESAFPGILFKDKKPLGTNLDFTLKYHISKKSDIFISVFISRQHHRKLIQGVFNYSNQTTVDLSKHINEYNNFFGLGVSKAYRLKRGNISIEPEFRAFINTYFIESVELSNLGNQLFVQFYTLSTALFPEYHQELGFSAGTSIKKSLGQHASIGFRTFYSYAPTAWLNHGFQIFPFIGVNF